MKINGGGSIKPVSTTGLQDVAKGGPLGPTAPAPTRGEKVELSQEADQLRRLEGILADVGVVDIAKVEAVKQAIVEGHLSVDSDVVADKLLSSVREFLVRPQS